MQRIYWRKMHPCRAISERRCSSCRVRRNRSPRWSNTWNAIPNLYCAANRESRRENTLDGRLSPESALRLRIEPTGPFLYSERATARHECTKDVPHDPDMAAGGIAVIGGSLRIGTQHLHERSHRTGA